MKSIKFFTKLLKFLIIGSLFLVSCSVEDADVVPDTFIDIEINMNNFPIGNTQSMIITNTMVGVPNLGYDNNGIIIYRNDVNEFYAYDRTCTYHVEESIAIEKSTEYDQFAVCPVCKSTYSLIFSGFPDEKTGPATKPLKQYRTSYYPSNMTLRITNF